MFVTGVNRPVFFMSITGRGGKRELEWVKIYDHKRDEGWRKRFRFFYTLK